MQSRAANQQSFVRTDFTLKYLHLEDELKKSAFFKVSGSQAAVFTRSWVDYTAHNDVLVLAWAHGGLEQIQLDYCSKHELGDSKPTDFLTFIAQLKAPVIIAVDFMAVDIAAFATLIKQVKEHNKKLNNVETVQHNAADSIQQISIVTFIEDDLHLNENQQSALVEFKTSLFVGEVNANVTKTRKSSATNQLLALTVIAGLCAVLWLNQETVANLLTNKVAQQVQIDDAQISPSLTSNIASAALANVETDTEQTTVLLEINDDGLIERAEPIDKTGSEIEIDNGAQDLQSEVPSTTHSKDIVLAEFADNAAQSQEAVAQEAIAINEVLSSETIAQSNNLNSQSQSAVSIADDVLDTASETIAQQNNPNSQSQSAVSIVDDVLDTASETIAQSNKLNSQSQSAASITDDALDTTSEPVTDEQKITILIDSWISGWQQQDFSVYSQSYSSTYSANKSMSHKQWLAWRKKRIEKPKWIKLSRTDIVFAANDDKATVHRITFTLDYSSPNYKDKTLKRLDVENIDGHYKIVAEENIKVTRLK